MRRSDRYAKPQDRMRGSSLDESSLHRMIRTGPIPWMLVLLGSRRLSNQTGPGRTEERPGFASQTEGERIPRMSASTQTVS